MKKELDILERLNAIVTVAKTKRGIPTVIMYNGRRYVLDDRTQERHIKK